MNSRTEEEEDVEADVPAIDMLTACATFPYTLQLSDILPCP